VVLAAVAVVVVVAVAVVAVVELAKGGWLSGANVIKLFLSVIYGISQ